MGARESRAMVGPTFHPPPAGARGAVRHGEPQRRGRGRAVCVSVAAERALQTPTNYFILSLAAADLLLALLVLPLFVYSEVQGGVWLLSPGLCDALMAMDVMLCTASIFNLCAISVDRRRRTKISRRERKAMRVLPVVVGAFLLCWTPFFVVHISRALCPTCAVPPRLVSAVTWLGYVNSALNPVIYTAFNAEFRTVFRKALRLCY
ncbi:D(4) dopamine receptor [Neophocaena asiaeorientalis asiaeorientalis]|uniref:D(4) dopamine receptor n=1 Tax=Neophocaena asiaeorientalis asiaeorientalis TaxID=1706337 RepID=A0A341BSR7_NEOAA|nr:D(4) dopamine receptor [Neophocaena asiaeorientalis asiaeorientalis]